LSTGSSLRDACHLLLTDYNIKVKGAFFLVDRSQDREKLKDQPLLDPILKDVKIVALWDLNAIDMLLKK
jgi:hypothetical protein